MVADASNLLGAIDNGKLLSSVNFGASLLDGPAIVVVTTQDASADATVSTAADGGSALGVRTTQPGVASTTSEVQEVGVAAQVE